MQLSIVVPAHNEAGNIGALVREIAHALGGNKVVHEIVLVDDGSTDATPEVLQALRTEYPQLRLLRHRTCTGQSTAIHTGVRAARSPLILTMDGDGQNDPADIARLLETYEREGGLGGSTPYHPPQAGVAPQAGLMVVGHRKRRLDGAWRKVSSVIANAVRSWILRDSTPDTGCGLKVFPRELFMKFPHFDHMHRFLPALARRAGARVVSVEVGHRPRLHGDSHYGTIGRMLVGIGDLLGVFWLMRRAKKAEIENEK